jgi:hypothetical protein
VGFSSQEKDNLLFKAIAANVIDANSVAQWYESRFPYENTVDGAKVWTELHTIKQYPAANPLQAENNVLNFLSSQVELRLISNPVHLTPVSGSNNSTFVALSLYNDFSSGTLDNWLAPVYVPQSNGAPSNGYAIRLYNGNPNSTGTEISTTDGMSGTGDTASVSWFFNYSMGLLFLSKDFVSLINPLDLWITGFRYIGQTALNTQTGGGGITNHGGLFGLENDDHPYYMHTSNSRTVTAVHELLNGISIGDAPLKWLENANPIITQDYNNLNDGYNLTIKAQDSVLGTGGNLLLSGGSGAVKDGYVAVGSGTMEVITVLDDGYIETYNSILKIGSTTYVPITNPVDAAYLYVEAGALKGRGSSGTVTTIAPAHPHCPRCSRDFVFDATNANGEKLTICFWCLSKQIEKLGIHPDTFIIDRVEKL